jgi:hypothetical protein
MASPQVRQRSSSDVLAQALAWLGQCLIALFLLVLSGQFLPPQLLNPDWQLSLTSTLVDNGAYPLLGVNLVFLAHYIDPANQNLANRQALLRSLACWACIAYLLLAPLQGLIFGRGLSQAAIDLNRQSRTARDTMRQLRAAITTSSTLPELISHFRLLQAPPLPADAGAIPLAELKSTLLARLESNERAMQEGLNQPLLIRLWLPLQKTLRNAAAALVLAIGFAAVAMPKNSSETLLQRWLRGLTNLRHRIARPRSAWKKRPTIHDQIYLDQIKGDDSRE